MLINNNGGVEFKLYHGKSEYLDKYIAAANYHGKAQAWAESCGFDYLAANNMNEYIEEFSTFVAPSTKPILLEAFVSDEDESKAYLSIIEANTRIDANTSKSFKDSLKGFVKKIIR